MTTKLVFVSEVRRDGRTVKLWSAQDHETGRFVYGPSTYADCVAWRRGRGRAL